MTRTVGLLTFITLVLSGCASEPLVPSVETKRGDRVGLLVDLGEGPTHTHVGTTAFNNFEKKYPYRWNLDAAVAETLSKALSAAGFTVVNLENEGMSHAGVGTLLVADGEKWKVAPGKEELVRELLDRKGLKAVIALKETRVTTALECAGGPCTERQASASGLYTRSFLGSTRYHAVAAYGLNVYMLAPLADLAKGDPLRTILKMPVVPMDSYPAPAKFDSLTEAELAPARGAVLSFTQQIGAEVARAMNPK
jgi:hypothetical protein